MPRKPIPARINVMLDHHTIRRLNRIEAELPDVSSRSAAIRYAARFWEEHQPQSRAPARAPAGETGGETLV